MTDSTTANYILDAEKHHLILMADMKEVDNSHSLAIALEILLKKTKS